MEERKLVVPGIYRHFKNKLYCTIGVSYPSDYNEPKNLCMSAKHTELKTNSTIIIYKDHDNYYHFSCQEKEPLVLYKSLYDDTGVYARPLDMFLSEVDREKYPEVEADWRMELVGGLYVGGNVVSK